MKSSQEFSQTREPHQGTAQRRHRARTLRTEHSLKHEAFPNMSQWSLHFRFKGPVPCRWLQPRARVLYEGSKQFHTDKASPSPSHISSNFKTLIKSEERGRERREEEGRAGWASLSSDVCISYAPLSYAYTMTSHNAAFLYSHIWPISLWGLDRTLNYTVALIPNPGSATNGNS